jgi:hypothetical protein
MSEINKDDFKCPTCSGYIPNNENIGAYMGAISRHGHGEVCSACGTREALEDYFGVSPNNDHIKFIVL